jgi:site-specific recombinase XerD
MSYRDDAPEVVRGFLTYHETIKGHSKKTVDEYYLDLRLFLRYMKVLKGKVPPDTALDDISIRDVDLDFVGSITLSDVYDYLSFLARDRARHQNSRSTDYGLNANSRARKIATLRSFYKYLTVKTNQLKENPVQDMDAPKKRKTLPRYLNLDESETLLESIDGANRERDYCILMIFLSCGLRISELVGLNVTDVRKDSLRVLGKGGKERIVYTSEACAKAISDYLAVRNAGAPTEQRALFLSSRRTRISRSTVHALVKKHLLEAGLDASKYSSHKLRHTAATLMLHNGVDVRTLQELLGHEHLNTTEIYTHVENEGLRKAAELSPLANFTPNETDSSDQTK